MARPAILKGSYINIMVEQTPGSGDFVILCGLNTKTFTAQKNSSDIFVPDCDDPEDIPVRYLNITGRQWDLSGDGVYNRAQAALVRELWEDGVSRMFRFQILEPATSSIDAGYYEGPAQVMNLQIGGPQGGENSTLSTAIASDGEWNWVDAA